MYRQSSKYSFSRYAMYKKLEVVGVSLPNQGSVLSVSDSGHLCEVLGVKPTQFTEASYPDQNILALPFPDESFDFVFSDQVLEHVEGNPQQAVDECLRVVKKGGHVVHTTCMMAAIHGPGDFWRFTPEGLALLHRGAAEVVNAGGWGHPFIPFLTFFGFVWLPIPESRWHPLNFFATRDRSSYPHVVWVVARK